MGVFLDGFADELCKLAGPIPGTTGERTDYGVKPPEVKPPPPVKPKPITPLAPLAPGATYPVTRSSVPYQTKPPASRTTPRVQGAGAFDWRGFDTQWQKEVAEARRKREFKEKGGVGLEPPKERKWVDVPPPAPPAPEKPAVKKPRRRKGRKGYKPGRNAPAKTKPTKAPPAPKVPSSAETTEPAPPLTKPWEAPMGEPVEF